MELKQHSKRFVAAVGTVLAYALSVPIGFGISSVIEDVVMRYVVYDPFSHVGAIPVIIGIGLGSTAVYLLTRYLSIREIPHPVHYFLGFILLFGFGQILAQSLIVDQVVPMDWWLNKSSLAELIALSVAGLAGYTIHVSASRGLGGRLVELGMQVRS